MTGDGSRSERLTAAERHRGTTGKPIYAAAAISWLGLLVHNVADLPDQTLLSPETLGPTLITVLLLVIYAVGSRRVGQIGLMIWAAVNLVGGALSVLPLAALPFQPEQTVRHYSFHLLYAGTQIPLLVVSWRAAFRSSPVT